MAAITLPNWWRKQPQYAAQIDWGSPLTAGLVFCAYPVGKGFYEVITGQTTGHPGSSRARYAVDGNRELAVSHIGAAAAGGQFANQTGLDRIAGVHTLFVEGSLEANGTLQEVVKTFETGAGNGMGLRFDDVALINNGFVYWANNANRTNSNSNSLGSNSEQFTHRVAFANDGTNSLFYAKGLLNRTVANAVLPTANANRRTTMLGSANSQGSASLSIALAWNRVLSLAEYQALHENPWQILKAPSRRIWVSVAGGGATTIDLTAASFGIAANGIQPALRSSLSAATLRATANPIQPKTTTNLGAASLRFTANQVTPSLAVRLGAAALSFTVNGITLIKDTAIQLTTAAFNFVAKDLTVTFDGAVAAIGNWRRGLQSRRNSRNGGTNTRKK